jgi:RNA polymerase sigma-70 factor (family 1)
LSIQDLIGRIQINEDESAFNELYKLYVGKLDDYAYSILSDREAAEEIVNDVFVKIWKTRKTIDSIKNLQVYLFVAVKNGCLNYLRSVSSKKLRELELSEAYYFHLSADPAQLLIKKETHNEIVKAVNELPARCKLIFKMVKENDLSCKEVATILGLSDKTVFAQLSIALKKLDKVLCLSEN